MKYQVIYADPPWEYRHCASNSRKIENHYQTMKLEDIKGIAVPSDENSVLYLWTTAPKIEEGLGVLNAWGFDYRSCLIWDKEIIGIGYWFRGQHEILLVGVKGKFPPPPSALRVSSVLRTKRASHSDKPDIVRHWIEKWYPKCSKLEMFCRDHTPLFSSNWHRWGNEIESDISLQVVSEELQTKKVC